MQDTIYCHRCQGSKLPADFAFDSRTQSGYRLWCRECCNKYSRDKRKENSNLSLIEAAFQCVYKGQWPEELADIDYDKLVRISGAPIKEIRLYVMRQYIEKEEAALAAQQAKNLAEFNAKQAALK